VHGLGRPGDVLIAISTSGRSPNILKALAAAQATGVAAIGFTGGSGGDMDPLCDLCLRVPANSTPLIQQLHIVAGHIVCALVEERLSQEAPGPEPCWAVFHIGDSRVYRLAGERLQQLSTDHSVVQELVDAGMISADAAAVHPQRHLVTRALGVGTPAEADVLLLPVQPGQSFLICSDGLTGELRDAEIAELLTGRDAASAAEELVRTAARRGASDNVTAVVVEVLPEGSRTDTP